MDGETGGGKECGLSRGSGEEATSFGKPLDKFCYGHVSFQVERAGLPEEKGTEENAYMVLEIEADGGKVQVDGNLKNKIFTVTVFNLKLRFMSCITPKSSRWPLGPIPDKRSSFGVSIVPAEMITSLVAYAVYLLPCRSYSTP